ncbi:HAD-IIIC family phosphatase [Kutzneria sp. CA-103260]|uniref:HAD-IIIC family phosphatase n=1 Tax=Kutzneria sp. CA-103260 TaxID=2802641 RepID=UPI001BAAF4B8|nr:HAD-IIIC family phosphatase [Kutzneria sp. CA-103260]QUQ62840.1 FkbH-like protein [Kutzneria sp. CA-103260]
MGEATKVVKCVVWDLDNTLWRGTLLEDGDVELAEGLREVLAELDGRGILHSVASKNDHDLAWARLESLGVAEYFLAPRIGWGAKSVSVREIAEELNFAPDTLAFVDDQPAERAEVAYVLPEVRCYPAEQALSLVDLPDFTPVSVTVDSRRRRQMYQAGLRRTTARTEFTGPDEEFLRSLELRMTIDRAGEEALTRLEELTLRTSQMNATGVHYPDHVLRGLLTDPRHEVLVVTMSDRFGDHGAVGIVLLEKLAAAWHLKLLATSCRVVTWGAGSTILTWLADQAARAGVHLLADFRRTDRNRMMEIAYRFAGFDGKDCACRAGVAGGDGEIQRLHLIPTRQPASPTVTVAATDIEALAPQT